MQSIEAFPFIGGTARIFLFFHRPFHRAVKIVEMATSSASQIREWRDFRVSHERQQCVFVRRELGSVKNQTHTGRDTV